MSWLISAYVLTLFVAAAICLLVAQVVYQRRHILGSIPLLLLLTAAAVWSFSVACETLASDIPTKVLWSKIEYLGVATQGTFFFLFTAQYTCRDRWLTRRTLPWLAILPISTLMIAATNEWHYWLWNNFTFDPRSNDRLLIYGHAGWFWINVTYNYALVALSAVWLIRFVLRSLRLYRLQTAAILLAAFVPIGASIIYVFELGPLPSLDWSPLMFVVTGLALAWAVLRYQLLDLVPVARDVLVEKMGEGVIVLDAQHRVVDMNPVVHTLLGEPRLRIGQRIALFEVHLNASADRGETRAEIALGEQPTRYLEMRATSLLWRHARSTGHLIVLSDITRRKQMEFALQDMNNNLERLVAERTAKLQNTITALENEIAERKQIEAKLRQIEEMLAQRVADQSRKLSALYELILFAGQSLTVTEAQEQALATILLVLGGDAGCVHVWHEPERVLQLVVQRGLTDAQQTQINTLSSEWLLAERLPRVAMHLATEPQVPTEMRLEGWVSYLGSPMFLMGKPTGALSLFWKTARAFSVEDIALFSAMADQMNIIVENVRLRQRGEATAVQQERRRLARDLHDSVTQSLHSLVLSADTAQHRLRQNKFDRLEVSLGQLAESARQALKEMRLLLYELRLAPLDQVNLLDALQLRLDAVERRAGIDAQLVIENIAFVPQKWESELYCIAMEALNNSLKHARATQVCVSVRGMGTGVELEIADDGIGMNLNEYPAGGMGLKNMCERAERLGGVLTLDSTPGNGMRVRCAICPP